MRTDSVYKMRCFHWMFLCTFFARFECRNSQVSLVTRRDTKEAICIKPIGSNVDVFPTFNLDKLQFPHQDVGMKFEDWQLRNDSNVRTRGENIMLIPGNQRFHFVGRAYPEIFNRFSFIILASNISVWVVQNNRPRGAGMLFELDHWNATTRLKDTIMKYCDQHPEVEGANCTIVFHEKGTNHLKDGKHWTRFWMNLSEAHNKVEMFKISNGYLNSVGQWTRNNSKTLKKFTIQYAMFAKSHQRNAALWNIEDRDSNIERTWTSTPKAITKCQFHVGYPSEFSVWPSSTPDPTIKIIWTSEEWAQVCDHLGIGLNSNDTEVPIKFCNSKGCNFSKCPHLQDDPSFLFDI